MKFVLTILLFRNQTLRVFFITSFIFLFQFSYSQKTINDNTLNTYNKNVIKGMGIVIGCPIIFGLVNVSIGYERNISRHSILELGDYYYNLWDEMGSRMEAICIMSGYKYVITSNKKIFNNTWYSAYIAYFKNTYYTSPDYTYDYGPSIKYLNGIGCALGRKTYFSRGKNWFVEIGFGVAFNLFDIKPNSPHTSNSIPILPRPIIQIGGKF